jgi:hypothetical protein
LPALGNALIGLRNDSSLKNCFAYDEMLCAPILMAALPGHLVDDRMTLPGRELKDCKVCRSEDCSQDEILLSAG